MSRQLKIKDENINAPLKKKRNVGLLSFVGRVKFLIYIFYAQHKS